MSNQFKHLFTPLQIGNITVKNRVVLTCHETSMKFVRDDDPGDRYIEYLRARAKGGVGLIIGGPVIVHDNSMMLDLPAASHDIFRDKLRRLGEAIHGHGAKVIMQLVHFGREMPSHESLMPTMGFTDLPSPDLRETPHEMTIEEIEQMIDHYVAFAVDCKEAGLDGVELHGTHGYMLQQSWSWWANRREDKYGEQMAFAYELINRTRAAVGKDFVVGVRISSDDLMPGGLSVEQMSAIAQKLEATGKIDLINTSEGALFVTYTYAIASCYVPLGAFVPLVARIREGLKRVPIIAAGRIKDHVQAEKVLADGHADLVAMTRAHVVDPEATNKANAGQLDDIRKCIACNQGCIERVFNYQDVLCLQNPATGRERELGEVEPASIPKKIMVVGAGPAGMECAMLAAMRGHHVEIYEREADPGGQLNLICKDPARLDFEDLKRFQMTQLDKLKVPIYTNTEATADLVREKAPECLVVATGSVPRDITYPVSEELVPGYDEGIVMNLFDVYKDPESVGKNVLILDRLGWPRGLATALFLVEMGKQVEVATPLLFAGMNAGATYLPLFYDRLYRKGTKFTPSVEIKEISDHRVVLMNVFSAEEQTRDDVDSLIPILPQKAKDIVYRAIKKEINEVYLIGDAASPRNLLQAVHDGFHLGRRI